MRPPFRAILSALEIRLRRELRFPLLAHQELEALASIAAGAGDRACPVAATKDSRTTFKTALVALCELEAALARRWVAAAHRRLFRAEWTIPPQPEFFDHHIDLFAQWLDTRNPLWLERGVFGGLALKGGGDTLELACGDGFNARNFYSLRSKHVIACDFDPKALATARRKNAAPNVTYLLRDIRTAMPFGLYQNVVWDAAIEHFTPVEIPKILSDIKHRLAPGGILSGYTIVQRADGQKSLEHHEYEFKNTVDLESFLLPHFLKVKVFETVYPTRHNLYFWASDGPLPLDSHR